MTPSLAGEAGLPGEPLTTSAPTGRLSPAKDQGVLLAPGTLLQDRYRIETLLGVGGMGEIYKATRTRLGGSVAIKRVFRAASDLGRPEDLEDQFLQEARLVANLNHPNVVRILDFFEIEHIQHLVMEHIQGETLEAVGNRGPQSESAVLTWADQILQALAYLHEQVPPVLMRDLSPLNVMLDNHGAIKLIDFGIARRLDSVQGTQAIIKGVGKPGYAAIEQYASSRSHTDPRTDLYALGATVLFLLTGQTPPDAASRLSSHAPLPDPRSVNASVRASTWQAIQALMSMDLADRPATAAAAGRLLLVADPVVSLPEPRRTVVAPPPPASTALPAELVVQCPCGQSNPWPQRKSARLRPICSRCKAPLNLGPDPTATPWPAHLVSPDGRIDVPLVGLVVRLGREDSDVALGDDSVSKHHARIAWENGAYWLEDLGSTNGSFVNRHRVRGKVPLNHGDEIVLGTTRLALVRRW